MTPATRVEYRYEPHPRQALAHQTIVDELLLGGSAGGGKSRAARAEAVRMCLLIPGSRVVLFRRTFPDLQRAVIDYLREEMPKGIARYNVSDHVWRFANGSVLELAYLDNESDIYNYQGAEYQLVIFEELTQFTERQYRYLLGRLRASGTVLAAMNRAGLRPRAWSTTNPGGIGHQFVKARFVDPAPPGTVFRAAPSEEDPDPGTRCYIPARVSDNPSIDIEAYTRQLNAQDPVMRRALLEGDWDILEGVRFTQWRRATHVIEPEQLPLDLISYPACVAVDWGIADPFAALWMMLLPHGVVYVYRELHQAELNSDQQVAKILASEIEGERTPERPLPVVMDPSMWIRTHKSPGQRAVEHNTDVPAPGSAARVYWDAFGSQIVRAVNARVPGWGLVDQHLAVRDFNGTKIPRLLVSSACTNLIRTLPALQRARANPEDVEGRPKQDDHIADCLRYGLMYLAGGGRQRVRPWSPKRTVGGPITGGLRDQGF